jgi:hypothetical protein
MLSEWATRFYHGPFTKPGDVIFKDLKILELYKVEKQSSNKIVDLDQGVLSLI